jgi:hypothetical protein
MENLKIPIYKILILLFHENIEITVKFTFFDEAELMKCEMFNR